MYTQIMPTFPVLEDEFLMENSHHLTQILLDNQIPLDNITKMVKKYLNIYLKLKERNDELIGDFTAQNYILAVRMALSEKIMLC